MSNLYLSTMWGVGRFETFKDFLSKAEEMGFAGVELNYQAPKAWLAETAEFPSLTVSSVHTPCPTEMSINGIWAHKLSLCSLNEIERETALRYVISVKIIVFPICCRNTILYTEYGSRPM